MPYPKPKIPLSAVSAPPGPPGSANSAGPPGTSVASPPIKDYMFSGPPMLPFGPPNQTSLQRDHRCK